MSALALLATGAVVSLGYCLGLTALISLTSPKDRP